MGGGLYCTAAYARLQRALAICSISDNLVATELSADERQTTFTNMMKIALEVAVKMEKPGIRAFSARDHRC